MNKFLLISLVLFALFLHVSYVHAEDEEDEPVMKYMTTSINGRQDVHDGDNDGDDDYKGKPSKLHWERKLKRVRKSIYLPFWHLPRRHGGRRRHHHRPGFIDIYMLSGGLDDSGVVKPPGLSIIKVNGVDKSPNRRGHNVVAVERSTGSVFQVGTFDTHGKSASGYGLSRFIQSLPDDTIVLVSVKDSADRYVSAAAVAALRSVGAVDPVKPVFRSSWLLVGYKGGAKPSWVKQVHASRFKGPSEVHVQIAKKDLIIQPTIAAPQEVIAIYMLSGGYDDSGVVKPPGLSIIKVDGVDKSSNRRGHNVVALDRYGRVFQVGTFDTYGESASGFGLSRFIQSLPDDTIVLVSVKDSANRHVSAAAVAALRSVGAVDPVKPVFRGSWLLVGYKGCGAKPSWVKQVHACRRKGPSEVHVQIAKKEVPGSQIKSILAKKL